MMIMGIDPSSSKIAGTLTEDEDIVAMEILKLKRTPEYKCGQVIEWANRVSADYGPIQVYVEDPVYVPNRGGLRAVIPQARIQGAIMGGFASNGSHITGVNVATWKARVIGNGHASKAQIQSWLSQNWRLAYDAANGDEDLCDSAAINLFGQQSERAGQMLKSPRKLRVVRR